jgi:glutathione S-transferase
VPAPATSGSSHAAEDAAVALRLHWSPDSANLVVRIALEELGLAYEAIRVDRAAGEHRSPGYLGLNPQGLIPVLEDGDLVLFETGAILLHLADRTGRLGPDGPPADDPSSRAAFLRWLFWVSNTLHADLRVAFYTARYVGEATIPELRAGLSRRIASHVALVDGAMQSGNWPAGPAPLLTDIYLATCLRWARIYPTGAPAMPDAPGGRVGRLLAAMGERPAIARALAAEGIASPDFLAPVRPDHDAAAILG